MKMRNNFKFSYLILGCLWVLLLAAILWWPQREEQRAQSAALINDDDSAQYFPLIRYDLTPTPTPIPTLTPSEVEVLVRIDPPYGGINASTFDTGAFLIRNQSPQDIRITSVRIDLSTAILPDMVYDPYGEAGDHVFKDVFVDAREGVSYGGRAYDAPMGGGYQVLDLFFGGFGPGGMFSFSVDVDPNSIRGSNAPGPNASGSVSGLELAGSTVTVTFDNGLTLVQQLSPMPGSDKGAEAVVRQGVPEQPQLTVLGLAEVPAAVTEANQFVRVTGGEPGQIVSVLVVDAGLFTVGVPGGGYDLDPYEANSVIAIREYTGVVRMNGTADVPVVLSRELPEAGFNYMVAVLTNYYGVRGRVSPPVVLYLQN
ncbi:MAG: hypothetical protein IAE79_27695 [Anaerolinea sp.]|nr:hypothetical protein [Anaerolinea sp.]